MKHNFEVYWRDSYESYSIVFVKALGHIECQMVRKSDRLTLYAAENVVKNDAAMNAGCKERLLSNCMERMFPKEEVEQAARVRASITEYFMRLEAKQ